MQLALGTVQFGMDYGIRDQKQPSCDDALRMLDYATQNGINTIDTAAAYGMAEDIVGSFLSKKTIPRDNLFIISKVTPNILDDIKPENYKKVINQQLCNTLVKLNTDYLDSYIFHSSRYAFNDEMLSALHEIKQEGKIRHCGVSVYYPNEALKCLKSDYVDFMQLPFSIFDQRMYNEGIFDFAKDRTNFTIHSRSAFIQGLILMDENEIPPFLNRAKPLVKKIDKLCKDYNITKISLAINYIKQFDVISHLVFGVDNIEQLKEDIKIFDNHIPENILHNISKEFKNIETDIVMPSLWSKC